ncbi:hypothetical protein [Arcobacter arenosus]|jgi:hypothetical protein|uniref:Chemotaxis protein n=1 Tax=Arcobacter arenosus TaxID=2576037 RepID=A0A5R8XZA7_9BACT|nr:hypothetical protein [Arcobacter arenosus]TLP37015.1 hypothetical protein FDK22_12285 [Arcobacter arenosus]
MSMSQEEIESLMNGLDFNEGESEEQTNEEIESHESMSEDDINKLIEETQEASNESVSSDVAKDESIDEILSSLESSQDEDENISQEETNIDDILKELDAANSDNTISDDEIVEDIKEEATTHATEENFDDILNSIEGLNDEPTIEETPFVQPQIEASSKEDEDNLDYKINSGVFPFPVEEDTKVVNQLSAVANDSEEKATKIFDVLSNILDYNNAIQNDIQALSGFNEKQIAMLSSLSQKFPNINAFQQNLEQANQMAEYINDANEKINDGSTEIFQAMELMQYHDINRQKIERVMSVIRKLSTYLNNLFEDENNREEVAIAKHIHGDKNDDLVGDDDLEALIAEFNK